VATRLSSQLCDTLALKRSVQSASDISSNKSHRPTSIRDVRRPKFCLRSQDSEHDNGRTYLSAKPVSDGRTFSTAVTEPLRDLGTTEGVSSAYSGYELDDMDIRTERKGTRLVKSKSFF
jgi:hypothetical protein